MAAKVQALTLFEPPRLARLVGVLADLRRRAIA